MQGDHVIKTIFQLLLMDMRHDIQQFGHSNCVISIHILIGMSGNCLKHIIQLIHASKVTEYNGSCNLNDETLFYLV